MKRWTRVAGTALVSIFIRNHHPRFIISDGSLRGTLIGIARPWRATDGDVDRSKDSYSSFRGRLLRARFCELVFSGGFDNATAMARFAENYRGPYHGTVSSPYTPRPSDYNKILTGWEHGHPYTKRHWQWGATSVFRSTPPPPSIGIREFGTRVRRV